jgi:hypothetical protein
MRLAVLNSLNAPFSNAPFRMPLLEQSLMSTPNATVTSNTLCKKVVGHSRNGLFNVVDKLWKGRLWLSK